jgi:hypothetical protein
MDPKPLNRVQLARICGNDPEAIRLLERLFAVAGQITPAELADLQVSMPSPAVPVDDYAAALAHVRQDVSGLAQRLDELAIAPAPREFPRACYGQFIQTTTQTAALPNTGYSVPYDVTDISAGVWLTGAEIRVASPGVYNFQVSVQLDKTSGGLGHFYLWFAKNGTAIPNSASNIRVQGNTAEVFASLNLLIAMGEGDFVELRWSVDDVSVEMIGAPAAAPVPAIPAVILTVSNNIEGVK